MGDNITKFYTQKDMENFDLVVYMNETGKVKRYHCGTKAIIGREAGDIKIDSEIVSAIHGRIFSATEGMCFYEDTGSDGSGSTNGTYVDGELLGLKYKKDSSKLLSYGSVIKINTQGGKGSDKRAVTIIVEEPSDEESSFKKLDLNQNRKYSIGRGGDNNSSAAISRRHATLYCKLGKWYLKDENSTNGSFVNNVKIKKETAIHEMDVLRFANCSFIFTGNALIFYNDEISVSNNEIIIDYSLSVKIEKCSTKPIGGTILLKNVRFKIYSGEMTLILAGSGVGKSVLFSAIKGAGNIAGEVRYGKHNLLKGSSAKRIIGLVPQDDMLVRGSDTVYDAVRDSAYIMMNASKQQIEDKVKEVLVAVGLYDHRKKLISKLSGGQKKRVCAAVRLLGDPEILMMDEPDSGLDINNADKVMDIAHDYTLDIAHNHAEKGKIAVIISHNVEMERVRKYYDKVVILGKRKDTDPAELVYCGSVQGALDFFETDSFAKILNIISTKSDGSGQGRAAEFIDKFEGRQ